MPARSRSTFNFLFGFYVTPCTAVEQCCKKSVMSAVPLLFDTSKDSRRFISELVLHNLQSKRCEILPEGKTCNIWCSHTSVLPAWSPLNWIPDKKNYFSFPDQVPWSIIQASSLFFLIPFHVFPPGSSTKITNEDLHAVTNDISNTSNRIITFSVIRHPKLGRLVMRQADNSTVDISTFTQDMVSEELEVISIPFSDYP